MGAKECLKTWLSRPSVRPAKMERSLEKNAVRDRLPSGVVASTGRPVLEVIGKCLTRFRPFLLMHEFDGLGRSCHHLVLRLQANNPPVIGLGLGRCLQSYELRGLNRESLNFPGCWQRMRCPDRYCFCQIENLGTVNHFATERSLPSAL